MWTISKEEVAELLRLDLLARLKQVQDSLACFAGLYGKSFSDFEMEALGSEEQFGAWDDYIEWKAYRRVRDDLDRKIEALQRGNFEVA